VSPANIDDASGPLDAGAARPLTRKELRAREKTHTGLQGTVPEQAYETGHDLPPVPAEPPAAAAAPAPPAPEEQPVPAAPAAPPSIKDGHRNLPHHAAAPEAHPVGQPGVHHADVHESDAPATEIHNVVHQDGVHESDAAPTEIHNVVHQDGVHESYERALAGHQQTANVHYDDVHYAQGHDYHDGVHHNGTLDQGHYEQGHYDDAHFDDRRHDDGHHGFLPGPAAAAVVAKPSKKVRRRRRLLALFLTLAVFVTAVAVGAQFLKPLLGNDKPSDFPGPGSGEVVVTVENGEGTRSVASSLESQRVVANADTFLAAFTASGGVLAPGDYTFKTEMKNSDAVNVLLGKDKTKVIYFALSAGLRIGESLQAISEGSGISIQDLKALSDQPAQFGLPASAKNLEGFLAPGEHRYPLGTSAKDILQSLVKTTVDELVSQGITDPAKQYEAVIVASIVQAEGGQAEYGDVAGAIYNRLKPNDQTGGFLQVDSAVTYGLGTKSYNFTDEQRQDKSNPYNTYANPGLPPGPIGSPGKTAIDAAAKPKTNDYLYWVTVNLDTKETKFAKTLAEHNGYVEQYNAWCMANVGRCT
jgi:UPF0755 protein